MRPAVDTQMHQIPCLHLSGFCCFETRSGPHAKLRFEIMAIHQPQLVVSGFKVKAPLF